ncbi:MAG: CpsD/CapB family tyrosine-protein kinase [Ruminococcaceae bacterium]|nr:CpsD/CapB family tyrosine-protein kinase [Oscillospiraceae bacterium]
MKKNKIFDSIINRNKKNQHTHIALGSNILSETSPFHVVEAYKTARTNIMYTLSNVLGCKKILITSASVAEGKTTTSTNLAIAFAQAGARVLIIDADMRRPKVHRYLKLRNDKGLTEYLGGFNTLDEVIQHSDYSGVDCVTAGRIPPNPSELLMSYSMQVLLDTCADSYDYIFVDSPPVNTVADPISIARLMTGAIFVVRNNQTRAEELLQAMESLKISEIKILGYILNGYSMLNDYSSKRRYLYKYHYKYQYTQDGVK